LRNLTAAIFAAASFLTIAPAFADKPTSVLDVAKPVKITVIPIDFDRDNPEHKNFGKLLWRGGLNLFANSPYFGGFSALAIDSSGKALLAVSDAGIWLRRDDRIRRTQAYVSFERHHRILRYPFSAQKFEPPTGSLQLPPGTKWMRPNSGPEAIALLGSGPLKGTVIAFSENLTDNNGNLQGWLVGGPTPGPFTLKLIEGLEVTDAARLPDGGLILLERFRYSEGIKMRIRRIKASEIKRGAVIEGETLLEASDALTLTIYGGHRSASHAYGRNHPHFDIGRQLQPAAADAIDAIRNTG
jgi:hypothetical protein